MTNKQIVEDLLQRIPEEASLQEIAREIEFIAGVRKGIAQLDRGESISPEEVERELPKWIIE
jgi:predicted transcriptional regulator